MKMIVVEFLKAKNGSTVAVTSVMWLWRILFLNMVVDAWRIANFLNLNLAQRFFNRWHSFAVLPNQSHLLEFQLLVCVCLLRDLVLLLRVDFLEVTHPLVQVKLCDLVFVFVVFGFLELILAIGFEGMNLISDWLFEYMPPFRFSCVLSCKSFINFLLVAQCTLH